MTEDNRFAVAANGALKIVSSPTPLRYTPDAWLDLEIQRARSLTYFGVERTFTLPLQFTKDGAFILKSFFYGGAKQLGIEEKLYLAVCSRRLYYEEDSFIMENGVPILNEDGTPMIGEELTYYRFYYSLLYKGEIDFSQFEHNGPKVTLTIMEGGITKLLKANENTKVEIELAEPDVIEVEMDGLKLLQSASYDVTNGNLIDNLGRHTLEVPFVAAEAVTSIGAVAQERVKTGNAINLLWNANTYILKSDNNPSTASIKWDFFMRPELHGVGAIFGTSIILQLHILQSDTERSDIIVLQTIGGGDPLALYNSFKHFSGFQQIVIPPNSRAVLYMTATQNGDFTTFEYDNTNGVVQLDYDYRKGTTYVKHMRPAVLLKRICEKIGITKVQSNLLDQYSYLPLTCGDALRGLENNTRGGIRDLTALVQGAGYVNGTYLGVPFNGGLGSEATADFTVANNKVIRVTIASAGKDYQAADVLTVSALHLGGAGGGFTIKVGSIVKNKLLIKTSYKDFYTSFNGVLSMGSAVINGVLRVESKAFFASYANVIDLGECKDLKVTFADDYGLNTIKVGYPPQTYDDVNGRMDFMGTHQYSTEVTRITKELNLVSVYRADPYGMELQRINYDKKTTTDSQSDNDVFISHIEARIARPAVGQPPFIFTFYRLDRSLNVYATGLPEIASMFNLWLSPKQNLYRNGQHIRSSFWKLDHGFIKFETSDKNTGLIVQQPGRRVVQEDSDVEVSTLGDKLYEPLNIQFTDTVPIDILDQFKANPLACFKFSIDGVPYLGLPVKSTAKPINRQAQTYTVLSAPGNPVENLIEYE